MPPMRAGFGFGGDRLGAVSGSYCPRAHVQARQARRSEEETLPVAWRPFHVLTPILQALRGVLLSRGIPRGCVAQHTVHEEEEVGREEGNARRTRVDGTGSWDKGR